MGNSKGTNVVSVKKLVTAAGGEDRCLALLDEASLTVWRTAQPMSWVPIETVARVFEAGAKVLYPDDDNRLRLLGRALARDNLRGIYRLLLRVVSVAYAVEQSQKLWSTYNDAGVSSMAHVKGTTRARFGVASYADFPEATLQETAGFIEGLIELCGSRVTRVDAVRTATDSFHFDVEWVD